MDESDITSDPLWCKVTVAFPLLSDEVQGACSEEEYLDIVELLREQQLICFVEQLIYDKIEEDLRQKIAPVFWAKLNDPIQESNNFEKFKAAIDYLYDSLLQYLPTVERMKKFQGQESYDLRHYSQKSPINIFKLIVRATLHSQLPLRYQVVVEDFYKVSFKVFCHFDNDYDGNDSTDEVQCGGCGLEVDLCNCKSIIDIYY